MRSPMGYLSRSKFESLKHPKLLSSLQSLPGTDGKVSWPSSSVGQYIRCLSKGAEREIMGDQHFASSSEPISWPVGPASEVLGVRLTKAHEWRCGFLAANSVLCEWSGLAQSVFLVAGCLPVGRSGYCPYGDGPSVCWARGVLSARALLEAGRGGWDHRAVGSVGTRHIRLGRAVPPAPSREQTPEAHCA